MQPSGDFEFVQPRNGGIAHYPPGASYGPRELGDYEFVWMIHGDAQYRIGEQAWELPEGAIILCRPGVTDFFRWDIKRPTHHGFFHFDIRRLPKDFPPPETWPLIREATPNDILRPLFHHIISWIPHGDAGLRHLGIANLLAAFVTGQTVIGALPSHTHPEAVERALGFMRKRLEADPAARIDLSALAKVAHVTPGHLCRLFQSALGYSPVETVRMARLDRAAFLLTRSNYSVGEIATQCGFASQFHFSRAFKKAFAKAPLAMRQAVARGEPYGPLLSRFLKPDARPYDPE